MSDMIGAATAAEHLQWCKDRAIAELDAPGRDVHTAVTLAYASLASDLRKHPDTRDHAGIELGMMELQAGTIRTREQMRRHIDGCN